MNLPLWLDMGNFGVVHACWDTPNMRVLETLGLGSDQTISEELHQLAAAGKEPNENQDRRAFFALENILKGPEISLPKDVSFTDKDGKERHEIRTRWYKNDASTYRELAFMPTPELKFIPDYH